MSISNIYTTPLQTLEWGIYCCGGDTTDKHSTQQKRLEKSMMTYESNPFSSYLIFHKPNPLQPGVAIFTPENIRNPKCSKAHSQV